MHFSFDQILHAQIGRNDLVQVNFDKVSRGLDPFTNVENFEYVPLDAPANFSMYCDVIEPELVCLVVDLDYVAVV